MRDRERPQREACACAEAGPPTSHRRAGAAMEGGTSHTAVDNKTQGSSVMKGAPPPTDDEGDNEPFSAVLVFCDPYLWYEAMQVTKACT